MSDSRTLQKSIQGLINDQPDDGRLRDHLEGLLRDPAFPGLTWFWGPLLYERNRVVFRGLIESHFSQWEWTGRRFKRVAWSKHDERLETWLQTARSHRDVSLVRRLHQWKYSKRGWGIDSKTWTKALLEAHASASTPAARATTLEEFDDWFQLDEETALTLYRRDDEARDFILKHLPDAYWSQTRVLWSKLYEAAQTKDDQKLSQELYRRQTPIKQWNRDAVELAKKLDNADELNEHLQQLHPVGYGIKTGDTLLALLELRGREVLPYVRKHLPDVIGGWWDAGPQKFVEFAKQREWWDLWATAIRASHDPKQFNEAVHSLLNDTTLSEPDRLARFRELAGVSREANWPGFGMMQVHALKDDLAEQVYNRYPLLIHGPLKPHVTPTWWQPYPKLLAAARSASDEELIDLMASRFVTRVGYDETSLIQRAVAKGSTYEQTKKANESLAEYYGEILQRDPASFACRASEVLTRVPAFTIYNQRQLLKTNPLARLLFVRSFDTYLSSPEAVRDLVEASEIHVQMLGYRVLARDDDRAREMGASMLDILLGTLLRPLHRKTRMAAFTALANAAKHDTESATVIHSRARQALRLPDKRYPKEELIGLLGEILHACPSLRGESEQPQVFGMERFQTQSEAMSCS